MTVSINKKTVMAETNSILDELIENAKILSSLFWLRGNLDMSRGDAY